MGSVAGAFAIDSDMLRAAFSLDTCALATRRSMRRKHRVGERGARRSALCVFCRRRRIAAPRFGGVCAVSLTPLHARVQQQNSYLFRMVFTPFPCASLRCLVSAWEVSASWRDIGSFMLNAGASFPRVCGAARVQNGRCSSHRRHRERAHYAWHRRISLAAAHRFLCGAKHLLRASRRTCAASSLTSVNAALLCARRAAYLSALACWRRAHRKTARKRAARCRASRAIALSPAPPRVGVACRCGHVESVSVESHRRYGCCGRRAAACSAIWRLRCCASGVNNIDMTPATSRRR